jgi:hypothetical protein
VCLAGAATMSTRFTGRFCRNRQGLVLFSSLAGSAASKSLDTRMMHKSVVSLCLSTAR